MGIDWFNLIRYGGDIALSAFVGLAAFLVWRRGKHQRRGRRRTLTDE